jgi:hypothetical protein
LKRRLFAWSMPTKLSAKCNNEPNIRHLQCTEYLPRQKYRPWPSSTLFHFVDCCLLWLSVRQCFAYTLCFVDCSINYPMLTVPEKTTQLVLPDNEWTWIKYILLH